LIEVTSKSSKHSTQFRKPSGLVQKSPFEEMRKLENIAHEEAQSTMEAAALGLKPSNQTTG
jgi:hypothetical protein